MTIHMEHPLFAEERQEEIVRLLRTKDRLTVPQLCEHFQVSAATIRNDIRKLAAEKKLKRISGGIIPFQKVGFEVSAASKAELNSHLKMKIAAKAAEFVKDGDTIILDAGTTTLELAKCLSDKKNLTIVINDLSIALYLEQNSTANIILLSGFLRRGQQCTVGPWATASLSSLNVDTAFITTNSFSFTKGFMTPDIQQAELKKAYIAASLQTIIMFDSSKVRKISFISFAQLENIDKLITDSNMDDAAKNLLSGHRDRLEILFV